MVFIKYFAERFSQSKPISMDPEGSIESVCINPLSPNIHKQILQTDFSTFPYRIKWEKLIKDQRFFSCDHSINSHRCCT